MMTMMSYENRGSFISSFSACVSFISFLCLTALASTSTAMLNKSAKSGRPASFLILEEKLCLSSLSIMLTASFGRGS